MQFVDQWILLFLFGAHIKGDVMDIYLNWSFNFPSVPIFTFTIIFFAIIFVEHQISLAVFMKR